MPVTVRVDALSKKYAIGRRRESSYDTLRDEIARKARSIARRLSNPFTSHSGNPDHAPYEEFWALRDISFELAQGERLGIIGRNGAGKSTLLKILSRITEPTLGSVAIRGRVASLLEVGTGFHPELTGRENIYLNGAILGMGRLEIRNKFDEIVQFAEIETFLDTPVKRYSSGMYVRLAFAVAAHLDPEILIVDEVLGVGDAQFQKKCLNKLEGDSYKGRTVLFVSHQMTAISALCSRAILLAEGRILLDGSVAQALELHAQRNDSNSDIVGGVARFRSVGNDGVQLISMKVKPCLEPERIYLTTADDLEIGIEFENFLKDRNIDLTLDLFNESGVHVCHFGSACSPEGRLDAGAHVCTAIFPGHILNAGRYTLHITFGLDQRHVIFRHENALSFELEDALENRGANFSRIPGAIHPRTEWKTKRISE